MALIDENIRNMPGAGRTLGFLFGTGAADAVLIVGQALGMGIAVTNCWLAAGNGFGDVAGLGNALVAQAGWIALFLMCFIGRQVVKFARDKHMDAFAGTQASSLRRQLSEHLIAAGPDAVQAHGAATVTTMLAEGISRTGEYIGLILPKVADLMVIPSVLSVALLVIDPISGVIALVMLPCIMWYMRMLGANAREAAARQHKEFQRTGNHFVDTLRGISTLKAFGRSKGHAEEIFTTSERFRKATMETLKAAFLSSLILDLFRTFALAAVAIMLGFRLMSGFVDLMPALVVLIIVPEYFAAIRRYAADFHASLEGKNQLQSICDLLAEELPPVVDAEGMRPWSRESTLELEGVEFDYVNEGVEHAALKDLNLSISGYRKVGIIGFSGSGKSTLVKLLAGYSSPAKGTFRIDGDELPTLACPAWQRQTTYIPQNPYLFHGTLRENIGFYCPDADDRQILEAAQVAGLDMSKTELPEGLDTIVGEGGRKLSGGQAQRVALARAFLDKQRRILVFDEPTAHLDIETEFAIKERMLPLMEDHLVLFATHRLHWMADMDLIVVLEDGRIAEAGTPEELRSRDGAYRRLADQLRGMKGARGPRGTRGTKGGDAHVDHE